MKLTNNIKDHILINYNQIQLFAKYLNIPISDIEYCLEHTSNKIRNPLRNDINPSLGFMFYDNGKLVMKDWANNTYSGDIFQLVGLLSNNDCNDTSGFINICNIILENNTISNTVKSKQIHKLNRTKSIIKFKARNYSIDNIEYWNNGGVSLNHLYNRDVYVAQFIWINNMVDPIYIYTSSNPAYVYYLGKKDNLDILQVYNPFEDRKFKFKTNNTSIFQAPYELYNADTLIITKSRKDKLVIECNLFDKYGKSIENYIESNLNNDIFFHIGISSKYTLQYCVTSFNSESARLTPDLLKELYRMYNNIIINVDFDKEGIMNGFYHYILYDIKTVFIGTNKLNKNSFTSREIRLMFNRILKINNNITLYEDMFKQYIKNNSGTNNSKDLFEYFTNNGKSNGIKLINKMFKND